MRPGISRGVSGGILGILAGMVIVTLLRLVFGFQPYLKLDLGLILGAFTAAYGFVWGMGGFSPLMNQHADDSTPVPTMEEEEQRVGPGGMVLNTTWLVAFVSIAVLVGLWLIMFLPGSDITVTRHADASVSRFGNVAITFFGEETQINQVFLLAGWIVITVLSLALAGGVLGFVNFFLNRNVEEVKAMEGPSVPQSGLVLSAGNTARRLAAAISPKAKPSTEIVRYDPMQAELKDGES